MLLSRNRKFVIIGILVLLLLTAGCGRKQHISIKYSFAISPKQGEVLRDVTVYLPFPTRDRKPVTEIYESLMRDYKEYRSKDYPDSKVSLVKTKYGSMLKIQVPMIDARGYGLEGGYGFEEPYSKEPVVPRFLLNPRLNARRLEGFKTGYLADSYVHAKYENAKELGIALEYEIYIEKPSVLPLDYVPSHNYYAHLGFTSPPLKSGSLVKYINKQGWQKVPLADLGFDKE